MEQFFDSVKLKKDDNDLLSQLEVVLTNKKGTVEIFAYKLSKLNNEEIAYFLSILTNDNIVLIDDLSLISLRLSIINFIKNFSIKLKTEAIISSILNLIPLLYGNVSLLKLSLKNKILKGIAKNLNNIILNAYISNTSNFMNKMIFISELIMYDSNKNLSQVRIPFIQKVLIPFLEDKIMDDDDKTESQRKQLAFQSCLNLIESTSDLEERSISLTNCKRLFMRNSSNYKYLENFLSQKRNFPMSFKDFGNMLVEFEDFLFQKQNKTIVFSSIKGFNLLMKNNQFESELISNWINVLVQKEYSADSVDINFNISLYLISIISNQPLEKDNLLKSLTFIFKTLRNNFKESNKASYEEMCNLLLKAIKSIKIDLNTAINQSNMDELLFEINKIYSEGSLSSFYPRISMILYVLTIKDTLSINDLFSNKEFNSNVSRLVEYINEESVFSLNILTLSSINSSSKSDVLISSIDKLLDNITLSLKYNEQKGIIRLNTFTDDNSFMLLSLFIQSVNNNLIDELSNKDKLLDIVVLILISKSFTLNCELFSSNLKPAFKALPAELINQLVDLSITNVFSNTNNELFNYKDVTFNRLLNLISFTINEKIEVNLKTQHKLMFLILLTRESHIRLNKKQRGLLNSIHSNFCNDKDFIASIFDFAFSNYGIFNKISIISKAYIKLLKYIKDNNKEVLVTIINYILKVINLPQISYVAKAIELLEKEINYLSYFDLKLSLFELKTKLDKENYTNNIQIREENKKDKRSQKEKEEQKQEETINYKNQLISLVYDSMNSYRWMLLQINKLIPLKIVSLSDDNALNDMIIKTFLTLTNTYSTLFNPSCDIVISLFSTDEKIRCLGPSFSKFIISAFKLTLLEEESDIKDDKITTLLQLSEEINITLKENKHNEKYNEFIKKFSNVLIDALFIALNSDNIDNMLKEAGVDLMTLMISFEIDRYTLNKLSKFLINFLKISYYSKNLEDLLSTFFNKCALMKEEAIFFNVFEGILSYNYIVKASLISILIINESVFSIIKKYNVIIYNIFTLMFDSNQSLIDDCIILWNKAHLSLDINFINSDIYNLKLNNNRIVIEMCSKAIVTFLHMNTQFIEPGMLKIVQLIEENDKEAKLIEDQKVEYEEEEEDNKEKEDDIDRKLQLIREVKILYLNIVADIIHLLSRSDKYKKIKFILENAVFEKHPEVRDLYDSLVKKLMNSINDNSLYIEILSFAEECLKSLEGYKSIDVEKIQNPLVLLNTINSLLRNLHKNKTKDMQLSIFYSLKKLILSTSHEEILVSCTESIAYCLSLCSDYENKISESVEKTINQLFEYQDANIEIGYYYIIVSYIRFKGISKLYALKLKELIETKGGKCSNDIKICILKLISVIGRCLKTLFEPIFVSLFDFVCLMISNREDSVRQAAMDTVKVQMKYLSGYGVRLILPSLIKDLHDKNWKSKIVNVEILGHFAFCAPKQLSQFLPTVIKELLIVFKDPHPKVLETAVKVLKDISSVITNPEIVDLSDILINAFSNPYELSKNALVSLLNTKFQHAIDPPSLGLIIPIIDYNLRINNEENKKMAAHLIGAISFLIKTPEIIYPYLDIILPNLKDALFDSSPDVRNAMAKAIGSLTKSLGDDYKHEIINWVSHFLETECDLVQRSGSAQAYAEILLAFGEDNITKSLPLIISKIQQDNKVWKEGYLGIFVFLPSCMGERFEIFFDYVFPLIIDGFSDDSEKVRNVSNKIFEICISIFAKKNTKELVTPLLDCLFDPNWRIRNSSIALIKTLISNLHQEFFKENSDYFSKELRDQILANTFILKADTYGNTATIANMIWRDYVDNIPRYLSKILMLIYTKIVKLLSSKDEDTLDIAENIIKILVTKFSDKFFMELLPLINKNVTENTEDEITLYSSFLIIQIASANGSDKLLSGFRDVIIKMVYDNISTRHAVVRDLLASIVYELSLKYQDQNIAKSFVTKIMRTARDMHNSESLPFDGYTIDESIDLILNLVSSLVEISKGEVLNILLNEVFKKPYIGRFFDVLELVSESIADHLSDPVHLKDIFNNLSNALSATPKEAIKALVSIAVQLEENFIPLLIDILDKRKQLIRNPLDEELLLVSQITFISNYIERTEQNLSPHSKVMIDFISSFIIYDIENETNKKTNSLCLISQVNYTEILSNVNKSIKGLIEKLDKNGLSMTINTFYDNLTSIISQYNIEDEAFSLSTKYERLALKLSNLIECILTMIDLGLVQLDDKTLICKIIELIIGNLSKVSLKPYLIKLSGKIIKVLSDKGNLEAKDIMLNTLNELINKLQNDFKPMIPHFRTILTKNLSDFSLSGPGNEKYQFKISDCIMNLLKYDNRPDLIILEVNKIITTKLNQNQVESTIIDIEILSYVVKFNGKNMKPNAIQDLFNQYLKIYEDQITNPKFPYDVYILLLSVLIQYSPEDFKPNTDVLEFEESHNLTYKTLNLFNMQDSKFNSKVLIKQLKSLSKDNSIVCLKLIGKIINKTSFIIDNKSEIIQLYDTFIEELVTQTNLFAPSSNIIDANMLIFILSVGYCSVYDKKPKIHMTILNYLLLLIEEGKINSQLLINTLTLLVLKNVVPKPDTETLVSEMFSLMMDEDQIQIVKDFFVKAYYLFK